MQFTKARRSDFKLDCYHGADMECHVNFNSIATALEILCNVALYIAVCYIGHTEARQSHCNWTGAD